MWQHDCENVDMELENIEKLLHVVPELSTNREPI
jgi:hypothetical protein